MHRRPFSSFATADEAVIGEVNTTPLIDVMLVLLILCVISIPMMSHKVMIRLPGTPPVTDVQPRVHRLALDAKARLSWDGAPTSLADLPRRLTAMKRDADRVLEISTDGAARYETFDEMIAVVKRSGVERIAFRGHHRFVGDLDR